MLSNIVGRQEAYKLTPGLEHAVASSPFSKVAPTVRTMFDPRKTLFDKSLRLLTGFRRTDVSPASQDAALMKRVEPLMKKLGARSFDKIYFTEEDKAAMAPQTLLKAQQLEAVMSQLADNAKTRKAAREAQEAKR